MIVVRTPRGYITGFRVLWTNDSGRPVYTWTTTGEPHDFRTIRAATKWVNEVWCCASTAREKRDKATWQPMRLPKRKES